ncbi:unnamed protein product [Penicillium glandicola]
MASKALAIIAGVGPGTGASIARKFGKSYSVVVLARNPDNYDPVVQEINSNGGQAIGISTDVSDSKSVNAAFDKIQEQYPSSKVAAAVFNPGGGFVRKPFLELTEEDYSSALRSQAVGAFNFAQRALPLLLQARESSEYPPTLIFTGATASIKGSATFAAFASAKFALRALAQSLAREFGPQGVHVSHTIIDGIIDIPRTKAWVLEHEDAKLSPDAIADSYWHLHTQPRTTFAFELDLRPYIEKCSHLFTSTLSLVILIMSSDNASPQAGQEYNNNFSNDSSQALPGHNPAIAKYNTLELRPEAIVKPDIFTLCFGFFGTAAWKQKIAKTVSERVENHYVLTARSPTQEEFDAIVEHGTRCLYQSRMGLPISSFLGTAFLYTQARKSPHFPRNPTPASLLNTVRTLSSDPSFRGTMASAAFKLFFILTLGSMVSSGYAVSQDAMHMLTDPRLKQFVEDVRKTKPEDVRKRKIQAANERIRSMRSGEQDIGSQMQQAIGTPGGYAGGGGYGQEQASYDSSASANSYSEYVNANNTQETSQSASYESSTPGLNAGAIWARGRSTQPESKSALDFMDDDDASPTAAEYRNTSIDGSPSGSAWDRIRRQNAGARSQSRQQPGVSQPSQNPYSAGFNQSDQEKYDSNQKIERDQAQAEFDRMIEAERHVSSEGSPQNRAWGS